MIMVHYQPWPVELFEDIMVSGIKFLQFFTTKNTKFTNKER